MHIAEPRTRKLVFYLFGDILWSITFLCKHMAESLWQSCLRVHALFAFRCRCYSRPLCGVQKLWLCVRAGLQQIVVNFAKTADSVSGPVAIVAVGAEVARADATGLFQFAAIVNINLAVVNLLPLPVRARSGRECRLGTCVQPQKSLAEQNLGAQAEPGFHASCLRLNPLGLARAGAGRRVPGAAGGGGGARAQAAQGAGADHHGVRAAAAVGAGLLPHPA